MRAVAWSRAAGAWLVAGALLTEALNLLLPHDDDDLAFIELVAASDEWRWLHAGLVVGALLVVGGLHGVLASVRSAIPRLASLGEGALWVGAGLLLSGLVVAGVSMDKAADNFVAAVPEDRSAVFFQAVGFDRLSYALYAAAFVTLLGAVPVVAGVGLWRSREPALGIGGVVSGVAGASAGFAELVVRDVDTNAIATAASTLVILWCLVLGAVSLVFGVREGRR